MEIEIEGEDGSKFQLEDAHNHKAHFGRGFGLHTNDRTVSRHHISFQFDNTHSHSDPRVSFEVIGRNPIWVWTHKDSTLNLFRKFEKGYLEFGDRFCLSGKTPIWFSLKKKKRGFGNESNELDESSGDGLNIEEMDVSGIDPVKEFGFLVIGHEFDHYPKGMIRNVKDWKWFLEEPRKDSEDDEEEDGKERSEMRRRKRKKGENNEDEEWTGESEDDKDVVVKIRKGKRPGYSTRSKDSKGSGRDGKGSRNSKRKKANIDNETVEEEEDDDDDDDDDEDDETLGGFIVDDEEDDLGEEKSEDEEEFEDDDDDDDD